MLLSEVDKSMMYMNAFNDGYNKGVADGFTNGVTFGIDKLTDIICNRFAASLAQYSDEEVVKKIVRQLSNQLKENKYE